MASCSPGWGQTHREAEVDLELLNARGKDRVFCSVLLFLLGPRLDLDPDIVAALDDDFDFDDPDNLLEDDFILQANKSTGEEGMDLPYVWCFCSGRVTMV